MFKDNLLSKHITDKIKLFFFTLLIISAITTPLYAQEGIERQPIKNPRINIAPPEEAYRVGGVLSFPSTVNPAFYLSTYKLTGNAKITIYKATEQNLLKYLVHDEKTYQKERDISVADFGVTAQFTTQVPKEGYDSPVLVSLPITDESGIWYMTVEIGNAKENAFIVRSSLGVMAMQAKDNFLFWAQDTASHKSIGGVKIEAYSLMHDISSKGSTITSTSGIGTVPFDKTIDIALASQNGEYALIPVNLDSINTGYDNSEYPIFSGRYQRGTYYLFTDRPIYKPGDNVYFKAIVRDSLSEGYLLPSDPVKISLDNDGDGKPIFEKTYTLSELGTTDGEYVLPKDAETGSYVLTISLAPNAKRNTYDRSSTYFLVEEYRKPEYELSMSTSPERIVMSDQSVMVEVAGTYFSGQPVTGGRVKYSFLLNDNYEYGGYFGDAAGSDMDIYIPQYNTWGDEAKSGFVNLDGSGHEQFGFSRKDLKEKLKENTLLIVKSELDNGSADVSSRHQNLLLYSSSVTLFRAQGDQYVYKKNSKANVSYVIKPNDKKKTAKDVLGTYKVVFHDWVKTGKKNDYGFDMYEEKIKEIKKVEKIKIKPSDFEKWSIDFLPANEGSYEVKTSVIDENGDVNERTDWIWVTGEGRYIAGSGHTGFDIKINPDKQKYKFDETAQIDLSIPYSSGDALIVHGKDTVIGYEVVPVSAYQAKAEIRLREDFAPNIGVSAYGLFGKELVNGSRTIYFDTSTKKIDVILNTDKTTYMPGDTISLDVTTLDSNKKGTASEVAVWAIDKALYELAETSGENIFDRFWDSSVPEYEYYGSRYFGVTHSFKNINYYDEEGGRGGGGGGGDSRNLFKDTAYWNPKVMTSESGKANVKVKIPDNLTTWVMSGVAVADGTRVGSITKQIVVTKDTVIRPKVPNMLRVGDEVTLAALVSNYSDKRKIFEYTLTTGKGIEIKKPKGSVEIAAGATKDVSWAASVTNADKNTTLKYSLMAQDGSNSSDIVELKLPLVEAVYTEKDSSFIMGDKTVSIEVPKNADISKSKSSITLSPDIFGTIYEGIEYLISYPFGFTEQTISRLQALIIAQKDPEIMKRLKLSESDVKVMILNDLKKLQGMQDYSGGFAFWKNAKPDVFVTMYAANTMRELKELGYMSDEWILNQVDRFLSENIEFRNIGDSSTDSYKLTEDLSDDEVAVLAMRLIYEVSNENSKVQEYEIESWLAALKKNQKKLGDYATYFGAGKWNRFGSTHASTGLVMQAILANAKENDKEQILKMARYLMESRKKQYFSNTFGTVQALRALLEAKSIFDIEKAESYQVELRGATIGSGKFDENGSSVVLPIDMMSLSAKKGTADLSVKFLGGEGYGLITSNWTYPLKDMKSRGADISIKREITNAEDPQMTIGIGDVVNVKLTVYSSEDNPEVYVAMSDILPAGLVPVNTNLKNDSTLAKIDSGFWTSEFEYGASGATIGINGIRKIGVSATYQARVVSSGTFVVPPVRAELMYFPEVSAVTAAHKLVIYDKSSLPLGAKLSRGVVQTGRGFFGQIYGVYHAITQPIAKMITRSTTDTLIGLGLLALVARYIKAKIGKKNVKKSEGVLPEEVTEHENTQQEAP